MNLSPRLLILLVCLAAVGCGQSGEQSPVALQPTPFDSAAAKARELSEATDSAATSVREPDAVAVEVEPIVETEYTPPYPQRTALFSAPRRMSLPERSNDRDSSESVVLLGFADLNGPRALLSVDREVKPLAVGEEASGVKVISIDSPRVVLQRGSTRWTETLE